jgi:hypothetical protein
VAKPPGRTIVIDDAELGEANEVPTSLEFAGEWQLLLQSVGLNRSRDSGCVRLSPRKTRPYRTFLNKETAVTSAKSLIPHSLAGRARIIPRVSRSTNAGSAKAKPFLAR